MKDVAVGGVSISAAAAVREITDGATLAISGGGGGVLEPDALIMALAARFEAEGSPRDLTIVHSVGVGDKALRGMSHLAKPGLVAKFIGGHMGNSPAVGKMIRDNQVEAYNLPLGVLSQLFRDTAAGRPGLLTRTGLGTFVDPRLGGGSLNSISKDSLVEVMEIDGQEYLFYRAIPIDFAFVRGSRADVLGNVVYDDEPSYLDTLEISMAGYRGGATRPGPGRTFVQVKEVASERFHPKRVHIPGALVGAVVEYPEQWQTYVAERNDAFAGDVRIDEFPELPHGWRRIIAERAARFVQPGDVVNLGVGVPDGVASVLQETGMSEQITMTNEHGVIGGVTSLGMTFGASSNYDALLTMTNIIDLYQGGMLDVTFLGFAQADRHGNVNVSLYNGEVMGAGGFIDIAQNARRVVFCGSLTAAGFKPDIGDGTLGIAREGSVDKFVRDVDQITFSGEQAVKRGQDVHLVTERAVFQLTSQGWALREVAPGVDVQADVLDHCPFTPVLDDVSPMAAELFTRKDSREV
ncbi:acyl CoA:acetate/3-ketoacid CoA transferase [Streptomyces sp. GDS52]|uniref:CoA-transferase n=1 Tax=Streptomyces cathayae TaxID=3031124 RepID=A0ABY8JYJ2_9ACTN|nr:CoA-transferase [Streptomyces sp. HUAS 5]WGD41072.1 CoA-transferase [Streptomyces sp. HUAS 5]